PSCCDADGGYAQEFRRFFFSSRRRHTRWPRDWSSDVCSSDLPGVAGEVGEGTHRLWQGQPRKAHVCVERKRRRAALFGRVVQERSEERRVGKECRSWWSPSNKKKKNNRVIAVPGGTDCVIAGV